jgi:hypothetical protein
MLFDLREKEVVQDGMQTLSCDVSKRENVIT